MIDVKTVLFKEKHLRFLKNRYSNQKVRKIRPFGTVFIHFLISVTRHLPAKCGLYPVLCQRRNLCLFRLRPGDNS